MAVNFSITRTFAAPQDVIFRAMTDLESAGEWMPNFVRIERLDEGPLKVGSEWRETRKMFGREATEHFEVTGLDAPRRLDLRVDGTKGTSGKGEFLFRYDLEPDGDGTRVRMKGEVGGLTGLTGLFARFMAGPLKKACAKDLDALKAYVEEAPPPAEGTG